MQNAAKHGGPGATLTVRLGLDTNELTFSVHDDGRGFDGRDTAWGPGLIGIRDRFESVGGHLEIGSEPGVGTTGSGAVPWPPRAS